MKMLKKGQNPTEEEVKVPAMLLVAFFGLVWCVVLIFSYFAVLSRAGDWSKDGQERGTSARFLRIAILAIVKLF